MGEGCASVSVLSANYNNGRYLDSYFESIYASTLVPDEIVIVDDGSRDDSREIILRYAQKHGNVRHLMLDKNIGFANALNRGLEVVKSKYVMRLDPDDHIHADKIRQQFDFLENNPQIDIVGTNAQYFELDRISSFKSNFPEKDEQIKRQFRRGVLGLLHGTVMCKTEVYKKYRYEQDYVPAEDFVLFAQMLADGHRAANIKEPLTYVRVHAGSVSNDLSFKAIEVPFLTSNRLFGMNHGPLKIKIFYYHLKYYRKFLFSPNKLKKLWYIALSSLLQPGKILARIKR
jgi:glycosyltransferase involved in cell wall biosynthesis